MARRHARPDSAPLRTPPVFEQVITDARCSFLWRQDDYPCERNRWNTHPEVEIHLITNAAGVLLAGDHIGRFEPGHLSIVGGDMPHDWVTDLAPGEVIRGRDVVLQFDAERVRDAAASFPELEEVGPFLVAARHGLTFHGEVRRQAADLLLAIGPARGVRRLALFLELLGVLSRAKDRVRLSSDTFAPRPGPAALDLVQRMLAHVFDNVTDDLRLAEIAALGGMGASACSRFFKKNTGNSFTDHVTKLRIGRACDLLANSALPITDVCFEVGYANISNFNRNFLRQRGQTPSAYRRMARRRAG